MLCILFRRSDVLKSLAFFPVMLTCVESFARPWPIGSWFGCGVGGVAVWKVDCLLMGSFVLLIFFFREGGVVEWWMNWSPAGGGGGGGARS